MAQPFEEWYKQVPIVTRMYMTGCVATSVFVYLDLLTPLDLYLNFHDIVRKYEVWRLVSNFFFFDQLSLNFVFHMYFLVRYSQSLEEGSYRGRSADYLFLWIFGGIMCLLLNGLLFYTKLYTKILFMGPSLEFMVVYIWGRRNPNMHISFLGLFTFSAPFLPWVILGMSYIIGQSLSNDIMGIVIGHIYYFLEDIYPTMTHRRILKTPFFIKYLFDNPQQVHVDENYRQPELNQQQQQQQQPQEDIPIDQDN